MRKEAGGVPAVTGDSESNLTWSADKAAPTRQPGGVNTPGPYRPSANARTLNRQPEELATEWACSAAQPFGGGGTLELRFGLRSGTAWGFTPDFFPGDFCSSEKPMRHNKKRSKSQSFLLEGLLPIGIF
jgi:hypothetical protein